MALGLFARSRTVSRVISLGAIQPSWIKRAYRPIVRGAVELARYLEMLWAEAQQLAACNAVHDASSRLCRWLLQSADHTESLQLPLTQEFLAQMLGVRRTTVTLLAQEPQKRGAVKYSRGKVTILNRKMLEDGACECYEVIHHERRALKLGVNW